MQTKLSEAVCFLAADSGLWSPLNVQIATHMEVNKCNSKKYIANRAR